MSYTGFLCNRPPDWVGAVWEKYSYRIYKLCLQKCGVKDEADDLFQEVALRFCQRANNLDAGIYLLPWLETVLLHCHYSGYRKRHVGREIPFSSLRDQQADYRAFEERVCAPSDGSVRMESVMSEFSVLLEALNPLEKMIVELSVVGGFRVTDLSAIFGLSRKAVTKRKMRAYQKMREKMAMQKERIKMMTGRDASLREIIEFAG